MSESSTAHATTAWPHPGSAAARASTQWAADDPPDTGSRGTEHGDEARRSS